MKVINKVRNAREMQQNPEVYKMESFKFVQRGSKIDGKGHAEAYATVSFLKFK